MAHEHVGVDEVTILRRHDAVVAVGEPDDLDVRRPVALRQLARVDDIMAAVGECVWRAAAASARR